MKKILLLSALFLALHSFAQEKTAVYDEALAKSLNADEFGMKKYVFVILKTGSNTTVSADEKNKLFAGHMANIGRLAAENKLAVAGPFGKNDSNYRGIFILNVATIDEAKALTETDPAIKSKLLEAEYFPWYGTAALQETVKIHEKIAKTKM